MIRSIWIGGAVLFACMLAASAWMLLQRPVEALVEADGADFRQTSTASSSSYNVACGVTYANKAYCWGFGENGQLGNGSTASATTPVAVSQGEIPSGVGVRSIEVGGAHTCAISTEGKVYCWGHNVNGQLGNNGTATTSTPVAVAAGAIPAGVFAQSLAVGQNHTCMLATNGRAYCWGHNANGQLGNGSTASTTTPVLVSSGAMGGSAIRTLSAGGNVTCAIAANTYLYCWGSGFYGQLGRGSTADANIPVAVAQGEFPYGLGIKGISVGYTHACAIANNDRAYCWGRGLNGILGNGATADSTTPVAVLDGEIASGTNVVSISAGRAHTCMVAANNRAYCWGSAANGRLGNGVSTGDFTTPVMTLYGAMPSGASIKSVSAGYVGTCATTTESRAYCWGSGSSGGLGNGSTIQALVPSAVRLGQTGVELSQSTSRVYGASTTTTPGSPLAAANTAAELSETSQNFRVRAAVTNEADKTTQLETVETGGYYTCSLSSTRWAQCWGQNNDGQLGDGSTTGRLTPVAVQRGAVPQGVTFTDIAPGTYHTCAIASNGKIYCWGLNTSGQLGNGGVGTQSTTPVEVSAGAVPANTTPYKITSGRDHTCIIASNGKIYCWGNNTNGRLGDGTTTNRTTPVAVSNGAMPADQGAKALSAGNDFTCAIGGNGKVYCWGLNTSGQVGNGTTTTEFSVPQAVANGEMSASSAALSIKSGMAHTCVIGSNTQVYCWGQGSFGRLGNNETANKTSPVAIKIGAMPALDGVTDIAVGGYHGCAVRLGTTLYCWGYGGWGALGNGGTASSNTPVAAVAGDIPAGSMISQASAGDTHTCVMVNSTWSHCWGRTSAGQLGNTTVSGDVPQPTITQKGQIPYDLQISQGRLPLRLEYAPKAAAATCSAVATGWQPVTRTSVIAYGTAPPASGTAITSTANDPPLPAGSDAYSYQSTVQSDGTVAYTFLNTAPIDPKATALYDFVLQDRSTTSGTAYCLRFVTDTTQIPGSAVDTRTVYPEIRTAAGQLSLRFIDGSNTTLTGAATNTTFTNAITQSTAMVTNGSLVTASSKRLEVKSTLNSGWSVSMAATDGPTAQWKTSDSLHSYPYNSATNNEGKLQTILTSAGINTSGDRPNGTACSSVASSVVRGTSSSFAPAVSTVSLFSTANTNGFNCPWVLSNVGLTQTIPPYQNPGSYSLDMTVTVVAS